MDEDELARATKIKGYEHPLNKPINKFEIIQTPENDETINPIDDINLQNEQEERDILIREIEAKYQPAKYQHFQKNVSSVTSLYSNAENMIYCRDHSVYGVRIISRFWRKKINTGDNDDKSQVLVRCNEYNYGSKRFRKHQMPLSIERRGIEQRITFSPNPEAMYSECNYLVLNDDALSIKVNGDELSKEGYRNYPSKKGNEMFGKAILSPEFARIDRLLRDFVPATR